MNFIEDVVERFAFARPALIEVSADGEFRRHSFGELFARSAGLSGALAARGVKRGDVVMTLTGSRPEWVIALLACWRMGAVALPCNPQLRRKDLELRVAAANPVLAVGERRYLESSPTASPTWTWRTSSASSTRTCRRRPPPRPPTWRRATRRRSSSPPGTTGEPRGVVYPQRYLGGQRIQAEHWFGARDGEVAWCTAAPGWAKSTRNAFVAPWLGGAVAVLHDGRFDPAERLRLCAELGVNVLCQAPTEYRMLAKHGDLERVDRRCAAWSRRASRSSPRRSASSASASGPAVADGYGQTETGAIAGIRPESRTPPEQDGSMGPPLPGIETRIGEDGVLELRVDSSPTFFDHYLDGSRFEGEWWPTGDRVREDEAGNLWFEGRDDDLIPSSGYRIGPFEVESALVSHPAVAEAAAVAAPDPERGSVVRAVVVLNDGAEPSDELAAELQGHVKAQTAPYKYPRIVEFADSLPKTQSGKIQRAELRAALGSAPMAESTEADRRADRGAAGDIPQPDRSLRQDLRPRAQGDAGRRPLLVPAQRPLAGLHRPRQGRARLGCRRLRVRRLPQRLRRDVRRPREPGDRRRRSRRGIDEGTHFAAPTDGSIVSAENLVERFGLPQWRFTNSGTESTMAPIHLARGATGARPDHQGRGLLRRPPRRRDGLLLSRPRRARPPREPERGPVRRAATRRRSSI